MRTVGAMLAAVLLTAVGAGWAATIEIESTEARLGEAVEVAVVLHTDGDEVAGTENEIHFDAGLYPLECWGNAEIEKEVSVFTFFPVGCSDSECSSVKPLILSFRNLDAIADGSTLYWCLVRVSPSANPGSRRMDCTNPGASTGDGMPVETACVDGIITVSDLPAVPVVPITPRPTPTPIPVDPTNTRPPTPTRGPPTFTPTPSGVRKVLVSVAPQFISAERGGQAQVWVNVLESNNEPVEGEEVRFELDPAIDGAIPVSARTGKMQAGVRGTAGIAEVTLDVPPGVRPGRLVVRADARGGVGFSALQLFAGESPPVTPTPTPSSSAPPQGRVLVDTSLASVSAESGAEVRVRAFVRGFTGAPLNGFLVSFDLPGRVGEIEPASGVSAPVLIDGREVGGVVEAILRVPPATAVGRIRIVARAPDLLAVGAGGVSVLSGDPSALIQRVLLELDHSVCGQGDLPVELEVRAFVFDADWNSRPDREVSFESDVGQIFPSRAITGRVGPERVYARSTLFLPLGLPVRRDPDLGAFLPYQIRARSEGVEATGQIFIVPSREGCPGTAPVPAEHDSDDGCSVSGVDGRSLGIPWVGSLVLWVLIQARLGLVAEWRRRARTPGCRRSGRCF